MAKTKGLISCADTAQLICYFVFAQANCWFSHAKAHIIEIITVLFLNRYEILIVTFETDEIISGFHGF